MATLEKIRNRAALLIIVVGVALFAFIIGDALRSGGTILQMKKNAALVIDGEKVEITDYTARLTQMQEIAEANGQKLSDEQRTQLNNQLTQEYVQTMALEKEADALGLQVTADELNALILGEGVAQSSQVQQFLASVGVDSNNPDAIREFLLQISDESIAQYPPQQQGQIALIKAQWESVLRMVKMERLQAKFSSLMARSYAINKLDSKYLSSEPSRTVAIVRNSSTILADTTLQVSDAEVEEYYKKHEKEFEQKLPITKVNMIAVEVRPSAEDYATAERTMKQTREQLIAKADIAPIARNFSNSFVSKYFLTEEELGKINLPANLLDFAKASAAGAVNDPSIENESYSLLKVVAKKQAPSGVYARIIVLDSVNMAKSDSIVNVLNNNGDFAALATKYSIDPNSKENGGYLTFPNQRTGAIDSLLTPATTYSIGLDTLNRIPVGKAITLDRRGSKFIVEVVKHAPTVNQYKIAYINIPITFSDETYDQKYAQINTILGTYTSFEEMAKDAEKQGLDVRRDVSINSFSGAIANIPSSRAVVSWALKNEEGQVNDKLFRCGSSHLVIASVASHQEGKLVPLADVKGKIKDQLMMEKRGDKLVANLEAKKLNSLEAYATELNTKVDTLTAVSYVSRGAVSPEVSAVSMGEKIGTLSKPFRAGYEVVVVKPLSQSGEANTATTKAQVEQMRKAVGQGIGYRAFGELINDMDIEDNRARFY